MINVAIEAAKKGGALALGYFTNLPKVNFKTDQSPVTKADIETEKLIREIISRKYPDHGIIGEELPPINPKAKYQWVVDPIDGTRDFIRAIPFWATYIALLENSKPILGIVNLAATGDFIVAQKGKGAYLNNKKVHVSNVKKLQDAYISYGQIKRFIKLKRVNKLHKICKIASASRGYGNLGFKLFLEGKIDIMLESYGAIYDFAAPAIITEEAGGKFSDYLGVNSLTSGNGVWTNGHLHNQVINLLKS